MAKRNVFLRAALLLFAAVMATTGVLSATAAKYYASAAGTASARVAAFSVEINGTDVAKGASGFSLPLFTNEPVYNTPGLETEAGDRSSQYVSPSRSGRALIAPGTMSSNRDSSGALVNGDGYGQRIAITNKSEVVVRVQIKLGTITVPSTLPLQFGIRSGTTTNWVAYNALPAGGVIYDSGNISIGATVYCNLPRWRWAYEEPTDSTRDAVDTALGKNSYSSTLEVNYSVWIEQVD